MNIIKSTLIGLGFMLIASLLFSMPYITTVLLGYNTDIALDVQIKAIAIEIILVVAYALGNDFNKDRIRNEK